MDSNIFDRLEKEKDTMFAGADMRIKEVQEEEKRAEEEQKRKLEEMKKKEMEKVKSIANEIGSVIYSILNKINENGLKWGDLGYDYPGTSLLKNYLVHYDIDNEGLDIWFRLGFSKEYKDNKERRGILFSVEYLNEYLMKYGIEVTAREDDWGPYYDKIVVKCKRQKEKDQEEINRHRSR